ncbi:MAG: hypothetical protein HEQ25_15230 [Dolichospermum sp. DET73]|nr:hypothetical protein [Dolichospermum sp. DET73]
MSVVGCQLLVVSCQLLVVSCQLLVVGCQWQISSYCLFPVPYSLFSKFW